MNFSLVSFHFFSNRQCYIRLCRAVCFKPVWERSRCSIFNIFPCCLKGKQHIHTVLDEPRPTRRLLATTFRCLPLNALIKTIPSLDFPVRHRPCFGWWLSDAVSPISSSQLVDFLRCPCVNSHAMETPWLLLWVTNHCAIMSSTRSSRDGSCHKPLWFVPSDWCSKCPRCVPSQ